MKKKRKLVLIFVLFSITAAVAGLGLLTWSARDAAQALLTALERGDVPSGFGDQVEKLAANLREFGSPNLSLGRVRLKSLQAARAEAAIAVGEEKAKFELTLKRNKGKWQAAGATESELAVRISQGQPRLVFSIGRGTLAKGLQSMGKDKLLTIQPDRLEWLHQGWLAPAPYFAAFFPDQSPDLIVGMEEIELFGHRGRLAAAVARQPFIPEKIRVNITAPGQSSVRHSGVVIKSAETWQVTEAVTGRSVILPPGTVNLQPRGDGISMTSSLGEERFDQRLIFSPQAKEAKLELSSLTRSGRHPAYYGSLEVANFDGDLVIVNELGLERYLCSVVPSEMPVSFGIKALEIQAVAARTYALRNLLASGWRSTSAHVVDSVLSQVYNNSPENPAATAAVQATCGEIVTVNGKPVDIRFFSTSCGYTASAHQVWADAAGDYPGTPISWLTSLPQFPGPPRDLASEEAFAEFIHTPPAQAYDARSAWFRWQFSVPAAQMADIIRENLAAIFKSSPESVQKEKAPGEYQVIEEMPPEPLGELVALVPRQRGEGGILMAVDIVGTKGKWRVFKEYHIRHLLRPQGNSQLPIELVLCDGSKRDNFSLLPSAFVIWDFADQITFYGGGFGHGVGMSQYGVRQLAAQGWTREKIIQHYFPGSEIITIQQLP
mgnify:FL=1